MCATPQSSRGALSPHRSLFRLVLACLLLLTFQPTLLFAQDTGSLTGQVNPTEGQSFVLATATIPDLGVVVDIADDGTFRFDDLRPGSYLVLVRVPNLGASAERVSISAGDETEVEIEITAGSHSEEIVVSASALARSPLELASSTTSLSGLQLDLRLESSIGETLAQEPGVHSTFFGPGASSPVIRGQTGARVRTLEGGIGTGDVASVSADHAVTTEPAQAERIEILRGPGTLLYGSSAIGGVVNVIDERVPTVRGTGGTHGSLEVRGGTAADERQGTVNLGGGNDRWAWNIAATTREADDYEIPGFARAEGDEHDEHEEEEHEEEEHEEEGEHEEHEEEENPFGLVPNTDLESQSVRVGATYFFGDKGFLGVSVSGFDTEYGLPGGLEHAEHEEEGEHDDEHDEEHDEDEHDEDEHDDEHDEHDEHEEGVPVRIDMEQRRFDLKGQINQPFNGIEALKLRIGATDYEHLELEGDEPGTFFFNEFVETRVELVQSQRGRHSGSFGIQFLDKELEAVGAEAFLPATATQRFAAFTLQEIDSGDVTWQFGARFESQDADPADASSQSHDGLSASIGLVWEASQNVSVAVSAARSVRLPEAEELFSNGLHVATQAFEIGNPNLDEEVGLGLDVALRFQGEVFSGELTFFRQEFSDFIFQAFTGMEEDGFPVVVYSQEDATFSGVEFKGRIELMDRDQHHVHLSLMGDLVDAELDAGGNLPRISPMRFGAGIHYHGDRWNAGTDVLWVDDQDDVAVNESPTEGYTFLNANLGYRLVIGNQILDLLLRGRNLTDEEARSHTSYLKNVAPLPGRNITFSAKLRF